MMPGPRPVPYARFVIIVAVATLVIAAIGWMPTRRLAGPEGTVAMLAGCAVSLLSSALGGLPIALAGPAPHDRAQAALLGTTLRLVVAVVLAVAVALGSPLDRSAFLVWVALSYVALLPADIWFSLANRRAARAASPDAADR